MQKLGKNQKAIVYVHGAGGSAREAERYKSLFPDYEVVGAEYRAFTPWETKNELCDEIETLSKKYDSLILIANSIGAYFCMNAKTDKFFERAYFISPVVDMEKIIADMMIRAGVTERELEEKKVIKTSDGKELSWEYLRYVRENPVKWNVPTSILYGSCDDLTSYETIAAFAEKHGASITVMDGGEHWFHTEEQLAFLDKWLISRTDR